jgi:hypothetical protein
MTFTLVWLFSPARYADAQKMYKWTDKGGKVHFSNVAPSGEQPEEASGVTGIEAQGPAAEPVKRISEAPNEVRGLPPDAGKSAVSDEAFSSQASATRSRLKRELAQAKEDARDATDKLAAAKRQNEAAKQPGLEMLQNAFDAEKKAASDEDSIRGRKEKAEAKVTDIRTEYEKLHEEAVKRNGGAQPSWWLPIE